MDTLKAFDILRDGGFGDREAREIVRAQRTALESVRSGRDPDTAKMADELRAAGFDGEKARALARALRDLAQNAGADGPRRGV